MTRLPSYPEHQLSCRFCHSGMFLGNGVACYVCMHLAGREDLGKKRRQPVRTAGPAIAIVSVEDPVSDCLSLVYGLTKRLKKAKLMLADARANDISALDEDQQRRLAEIEQEDKDWLAHLQQEMRAKYMPTAAVASVSMVPAGTVHVAPLTPPANAHKDEGLMKRIDAFLAEPLPAGAVGAFRDFEAADKAQSALNAEALLRPADAVECRACRGEGHTVEEIPESPNCRVECVGCAGRGWTLP